METFSALLVICAENSPVPDEFPAQRPVTRSFDVFFDLRLNKRLSKQSWGWWFETLSCSLWRHRNAIVPHKNTFRNHVLRIFLTSLAHGRFVSNDESAIPKYLFGINTIMVIWSCTLLIATVEHLITSILWFRRWIGTVRQLAVTWANFDPDLWHHMTSLCHNELIKDSTAFYQWENEIDNDQDTTDRLLSELSVQSLMLYIYIYIYIYIYTYVCCEIIEIHIMP